MRSATRSTSPRERSNPFASATFLPTRLGMLTSRPWIAIRIAVIALRNAAAARINTSSAIRLTHSSRSRRVIRVNPSQVPRSRFRPKTASAVEEKFLLFEWRSGILRQLVFAHVRALHFKLIEEQRRGNNRCRHAAASVAYQRIVPDGDEVAPQRANVELAEHRAAHQLLMPIRVNAIQKTR